MLDRTRALTTRLLQADPRVAQAHARRLADALIAVAQGTYLLRELDWEREHSITSPKRAIVELFFNHYLRPGYDSLDDHDYVELVMDVAHRA